MQYATGYVGDDRLGRAVAAVPKVDFTGLGGGGGCLPADVVSSISSAYYKAVEGVISSWVISGDGRDGCCSNKELRYKCCGDGCGREHRRVVEEVGDKSGVGYDGWRCQGGSSEGTKVEFKCVDEAIDGVNCKKVKETCKTDVPGAFGNSCHEKETSVAFGPNVLRNRQWRKEKKEKKNRKKSKADDIQSSKDWRSKDSGFSLESLSRDQDLDLRNSLAAKWKAENALAKLRAERQLAILGSSDVQDEVKQRRTKLSATIERNMVSIEKTHATLRATGNVAGEFRGSAETVLTPGLSSGTISPDSSASMHEFRAVQKKALDLENENEKLKKKLALVTEKTGISGEHIDLYDQDIWTNNSVNNAILDEMYPNGYGMDGSYCQDGKVRVIPM